MGHLSARDSMTETSGESYFTGGTHKLKFLREQAPPLYRVPVWEPGGGSFSGTCERKEKYIWVPFLDPKVIKILNLSDALTSLRRTLRI